MNTVSTFYQTARFLSSAARRTRFYTTMASELQSPLFTRQVVSAMRTL